jgi:hypothetical protein
MGLNMCIEERQRQCKYLDNHFGGFSKNVNIDKDDDLLIKKAFQSCVIYRKQKNKVSTKKKIKKYEKKIKELKEQLKN